MEIPFIDIHCHLTYPDLEKDQQDVIERARKENVEMIVVGTSLKESQRVLDLLDRDPLLWGTVGLHPIHSVPGIDNGEEFDVHAFEKMAEHPLVVAIGECGIDFHHLPKDTFEKQKEGFVKQIELAIKTGKPLMLHIRDAYKEAINILETYKGQVIGDAHFFAGTIDDARRLLDMGYYISFDGPITFAAMYKELVEFVPLDRIMTETDAPFAAPLPYRGKRCEPVYVIEVAKKIAEIKKIPLEELKERVYKNAQTLFGV